MLIAGKYEVPDKCPKDCAFNEKGIYQGHICTRCPIFNCQPPVTKEDEMYMPLVEPDEYREDWALEWHRFFKGEIKCVKLYF